MSITSSQLMMIEVDDVRKSFGDLVAVDGVSFDIQRGEMFGLLGPNGAGKTTAINMVVGALEPDSGAVRINAETNGVSGGVASAGAPASSTVRRAIGVAPQSLSLYDNLTASENLRFFGALYGLRGARLRERVTWSLEFAGLTERRRSRVRTYSGGMKRRLNLACALVHDPQVIVMDEPTVGVDPQSRNHIFDSIETLKRDGRTIVYTTHYMEEAQRLCDRVAIMDRGRILAIGEVDALLERFGGRSVIAAELQRAPNNTASLPAGAALDGLSLRIESERPLDEIGRLARSGVEFATLNVTRPDLETVFLTLTGRSLRD